jgi:ABC-2 type transport system permease protein
VSWLSVSTTRPAFAPLGPRLSPYWQLARRNFQRYTTYRGATFAGVFTNTVFGFFRAYVLLALYQHRRSIGGLDATDVVTYTFVTQGLLACTATFGQAEISDRIRTGDIISDLFRPLHFQAYWACRDLGRAFFQAIFRGIPPFLVGALVFHLRLPGTGWVGLWFAVSLLLAVEVGFAYGLLISMTGFWLIDTRGPTQLAMFVMQFFSGAIVPISFFPGALHTVAEALPFSSIIQLPVEVFLGLHRGVAVLGILGRQLVWMVVLMGLNEVVARRALRRVVVQGG